MFGIKKNKNKNTVLNEKPVQSNISLVEARAQLAIARTKNINVIDIELRRLRNPGGMSEDSIERAKQSIKNAYYALNVIEWVEQTMLEMKIRNQLAQGMNRITEGVKLINRFDSKDEKPKTLRFKMATSKMGKSIAKDGRTLDKMEKTYERALPIDEAVDDGIVERLINGAELEDCIKSASGIRVPYSDGVNIDFSDLDDLVGDTPNFDINEDVVFSDEDLSDLDL